MAFNYLVLARSAGEGLIQELPIIYPDVLVHKDVAEALIEKGVVDGTVVAAGSLNLRAEECYGKSTTLGIASRLDADTTLINNMPYFHGLVDPKPLPKPVYLLLAAQHNAEFGVVPTLVKHNLRHWTVCPECNKAGFEHEPGCSVEEELDY